MADDIKVMYGSTLLKLSNEFSKIAKNIPSYRMPFCHQSALIKTKLLKQYKFDTTFKICADNDFFMKIYKNGAKFVSFNILVSVYDVNGVSSTPSIQFLKEELRIVMKYNKRYIFIFIFSYTSMLIKYLIKSILPKKIRFKLQSMYNAR